MGPTPVGHRGHQVGDLPLVGDIGDEGVGQPAVVPDGIGNRKRRGQPGACRDYRPSVAGSSAALDLLALARPATPPSLTPYWRRHELPGDHRKRAR
jgi:hypothetical protein